MLDDGPLLGFLMEDYKKDMPMAIWEGVEMVRKLSRTYTRRLYQYMVPGVSVYGVGCISVW
jgi:hypothetical protein